jgi:hypothetical protein
MLAKNDRSTIEKLKEWVNNFGIARSVFKTTARRVPSEVNLVVSLFELCTLFFSLFMAHFDHVTNKLDTGFRGEYEFTANVEILTEWINAEFNGSLLANFGLDPMSKKRVFYTNKPSSAVTSIKTNKQSGGLMQMFSSLFAGSSSNDARAENESQNRDEHDLNELSLYVILLRLNFSFAADLNLYRRSIFSILRKRLINSKNLVQILKARRSYDFDSLGAEADAIKQIIDSVVVDSYMMHGPQSVDVVCKLLGDNAELLHSYTSAYLKQKLPGIAVNKLKFILENPELTYLLNHHYVLLHDRKPYSSMEPHWLNIVQTEYVDVLVEAANGVFDGSASIQVIKQLSLNVDTAAAILVILNRNNTSENSKEKNVCVAEVDHFKKVVSARIKEIDAFKNYKELITLFMQICLKFKGKKIQKFHNLEKFSLFILIYFILLLINRR